MYEKKNLSDLAIFGGEPAFREKLHVGRPNVGDRRSFLRRINEILDRNWLTNEGPCVLEFEHRLADMLGVRHCIATCNGTLALEIVIRALGLSGEVIVPSFTFIATVHSLQWLGITPIFCDISPETYTLDPAKVEASITPRTSGILGVHLWGHVCDIEKIETIARRHHVRILYDASHAFGCSSHGCMAGNFGEAEIFSFHATKFINSIEGGMISTNDDEFANRARLMKNFGFVGFDSVKCLGTNGKMNEVSAAMGLTSLESMDNFISVNYRNFLEYKKMLSTVPGIHLIAYDETERNNYHHIIVEIDESVTGIDRDTLVEVLRQENVLARRYFYPGCHRMEPYASSPFYAGLNLSVTERIAERVISFPTGTAIEPEDIDHIVFLLQFIISNRKEICKRIGKML